MTIRGLISKKQNVKGENIISYLTSGAFLESRLQEIRIGRHNCHKDANPSSPMVQ
uniref:Uncharacterized protein n=1 Tax=Rhizophora mucronata TaxID=61149 RepID=A0A2P2NZ33_RHIMU